MAGFAPGVGVTNPVPGIARLGSKVLIALAAPGQPVVLPLDTCIRCGQPANGKPVTKSYYWHHPALYIALLSPIIYLILALALRKSMKVTVPLCAQHAQRRSIGVTLAWVLPLVGIADAIILPQFNVDTGIVVLVCVGLMFAGLVIWAVVGNPIRPRRIDQLSGEFTGFCDAYLKPISEVVVPAPLVAGHTLPTLASGQTLPPPPPIR